MTEHVKSTIDERVDDLKGRLSTIVGDVTSLLDKKGTLKKDDKVAIRNLVNQLYTDMASNMSFYVESLEESIAKAESEAKMRVEAHVTSTINKLGKAVIDHPDIVKKILMLEESGEDTTNNEGE